MAAHAVLPATVHTFLFKEGRTQVLLLLRARTGYQDGMWGLPAGRLDMGEPVAVGACRELAEEAGVRADPASLRGPSVLHERLPDEKQCVRFYFACETWEGEPRNAEPDRCDGVAWFPVAALPENVVPSLRAGLSAVLEGRGFAETGFPDALPASCRLDGQPS